jgi:hypothetical protein
MVVVNCVWCGTEAVIECCVNGVICVVVLTDDGNESPFDRSILLTNKGFWLDSNVWTLSKLSVCIVSLVEEIL